MASGSFTSSTVTSLSSTTPRSIKVTWESTPNIANNTSTLKYTISTPTGTTTNWVYAYSIKVVINGTTVYSVSSQTKIYGSTTLKTGTLTIAHNSNGSKSVSVSISAALYSSSTNSTYSGNITLDTIARASSITSAVNKTLGSACSISWTPASSSFTYKLKFSLGSTSYTTGTISPNRTTAYTYTGYTITTATFAPAIPNATTGTMTATLYTYSGSTLIGTSSKTFTVTIPSSVIPTLNTPSVTIDNSANATVKGWGIAVAGYTKAKVTASASGTNGSTISSFTITGGYSTTQNGTTNSDGTKELSYTGGVLTSGSKTFTVTAKDSRGRVSASKTTSAITVYAYSKPLITSFTVARNSSSPTKMIAKANWSFSSVNAKNTATGTLYYKKSTASGWTTYGAIALNTSVTLTPTFAEDSSYDFKIIVNDALNNTDECTVTVSTIKVTMDWRAGGNGVALGKICETDGFEVAMPMYPMNGIYPVTIPSGSDFNDYNVPNIYSGSYLGQMLNIPSDIAASSTAAFILEVFQTGLSTMRLQRLTTTINSIVTTYERYYNSLKVWTDWFCVSRIGQTGNPILWSGASYMKDTQTASLSQPISLQPNGIILVFSRYYPDTSEAKDETFKEFFIPKTLVATHSGKGHCFDMATHRFTYLCTKYLYISDTQITGHADNSLTGTSALGLAYDNRVFVLRYVLGC